MRISSLALAAFVSAGPVSAAPPVGGQVRFGVQTPLHGTTWQHLRATWREIESLGFDSVWVNDHLLPGFGAEDGPQLEAWTTLAALAASTKRIRIGVMVTGNTYRNPALLAKMATTVDHVSKGRLVLGIGAGWFEHEHRAYGFAFGTARERAQRLGEALQVITALWGEDHPSLAGRYYALERAPYAPANVQIPHPPIVIGGRGKKWIVPLVARYADGWNADAGLTPDQVRERRLVIEAECARIGRKPCPSDVSVSLPLVAITSIPFAGPVLRFGARAVVPGDVAGVLLAGSPQAIAEQIRPYVDAGANGIIVTLLPPYDRDALRRLATEVVPLVRNGHAPPVGGPGPAAGGQ